ncbi:MAG: two-component sensor histidine kinase [Solirubrobacterales bacterium]|nr:two-component sensor histidine kinase [Solirubrobacterales bacterium]
MTLRTITRRIAVQEDAPSILQAAVDGAREVLGTAVAFAASAQDDRNAYVMSATSGTTSAALGNIVIPPMVGLGGRVARLQRPMAVHDYLTDESITRDFVDVVVGEEGLRGVACVPIHTALGVAGLLYVAIRRPGYLADRALDTLADIGTSAGVALDGALGQARQRDLSALRERQHLASALHDSVAQTLFAIGVEAKRSRDGDDPRALADALSEIAALASQAGNELRETLHRINEIPSRLSLAVALDAEARAFERLGELTVRVVTDGDPRPLPEVCKTLICDTMREGVRNAVKHGGAHIVVVHVRYGHADVGVTVQSDRSVARQEGRPPRPTGGLALLLARAQALRGELELVIGEEGEAIVRLTLPSYRTDVETLTA